MLRVQVTLFKKYEATNITNTPFISSFSRLTPGSNFIIKAVPLVLILIIADQILNGFDDFFLQIQHMFM